MKTGTNSCYCVLMLLFLLAISSVTSAGDTVYVKDGSAGNGSGWANAYGSLQSALDDAAGGDEIWVAAGTYYPASDYGLAVGDRGRHFRMMNGVAIYGGFDGTETAPAQRDVRSNVTILSGDIGTRGDNSDNCYHLFYHPDDLNLDATAVLDGFTITAGNANNTFPHTSGGGMYNDHGSPTVIDCIFIGNSADYGDGGGMLNYSSSPTIIGCTFIASSAIAGGGILNYSSSPTLTDCAFIGNSADYYGGAMFNYSNSSPTVAGCIFTGNLASDGGGICNQESSSPTVANCTFTENLADNGNCGGISNRDYSNAIVNNCILWANTATPDDYEIYNDLSIPIISYCDIAGSFPEGSWDISLGTDGGGNIDANPLFVDADGPDDTAGTEDDNLRLSADSPCIDAGDNEALPHGVTTDLDGHTRIVDGNCDSTETVDMGAYELDWKYLGDFAGGCDVNLVDFAVLASNWLQDNPAIDIAPCANPDGVIDLKELSILTEHWLEGTI